jgi:hypothetical protein
MVQGYVMHAWYSAKTQAAGKQLQLEPFIVKGCT